MTDGDLISRQAVLDIFGDIHPLDYNARAYVAQIKELSSEKVDGDLISRQAAIDIVVFECGKWTGLAKEISKQLKQLPSADNTAEWVSKEGIFGAAYCSKCDYELHTDDTNYCPNCGRRMLGEKTE